MPRSRSHATASTVSAFVPGQSGFSHDGHFSAFSRTAMLNVRPSPVRFSSFCR